MTDPNYGRTPRGAGGAWYQSPLAIGAIVVVVALVVFLLFRGGMSTTEQAGVDTNRPTATNQGPPGPANLPPTTPKASPPAGSPSPAK